MSTVIQLNNITKHYNLGGNVIPVLKGINFQVEKGEFVSIMGPSGSGKSTLMNLLGLLDHPDSGSYLLDGQEVAKLNDDERATIRNITIGFVFQSFYLLPRLTALQNVQLPLFYRGLPYEESQEKALATLEKVGMKEYKEHRPTQLSGGQQQRVAIARALVGRPSVVLADEPTGALDSKIGKEVMDFLSQLNEEEGTTIVLITHDPLVAHQCQRIVKITDGFLLNEEE